MESVILKLRGGNRRSLGRSHQVVMSICRNPKVLPLILDLIVEGDPVVKMRAADAIEKATASRPELLQPYKETILNEVAAIDQQEVRWHVAQMLPRLQLSPRERDLAVAILFEYLDDKSSIVRTFSMQALCDFALRDQRLLCRVVPVLEHLTATGTPAMRSRGRKLLNLPRQQARLGRLASQKHSAYFGVVKRTTSLWREPRTKARVLPSKE
jgi:hypothetical protein